MKAHIHEPTSATMPAGRYIVGDPCYAVPSEDWDEWLAAADPDVFGPQAQSGHVKRVLLGDVKGHTVLGIGTEYGDGEYTGSDGNRYPVDSGMIGLVPEEYGRKEQQQYRLKSPVVEFSAPFTVAYEDGIIVLGHIRIDTN